MRIFLLAVAAALPSCATVCTPTSFRVPIDSVPTGATVLQDGKELGCTPLVLELGRVEKPTVTLRSAGHHDQVVQVENKMPPLPFLVFDIVVFPLMFVDAASGAKHQIDTTPLSVHLTPAGAAPPPIWRRSDFDPAAR